MELTLYINGFHSCANKATVLYHMKQTVVECKMATTGTERDPVG